MGFNPTIDNDYLDNTEFDLITMSGNCRVSQNIDTEVKSGLCLKIMRFIAFALCIEWGEETMQ